MAHFLKDAINNALYSLGFDLKRHGGYNHIYRLRQIILERNRIDLVLDVGGGTGGHVPRLRKSGYAGRAVSFEPMREPYAELLKNVARDSLWSCKNIALGSESGSCEINVSGNSVSSSLLPMTERHIQASGNTAYTQTERIQIAALDSIRGDVIRETDRIYVKLDVQGFEKQVLLGAERTLDQIHVIECELSLTPYIRILPCIGK